MTDVVFELNKNLKLPEKDFKLLSQCQEDFNKKRYSDSLKAIEQLEQSIGTNAKIRHNKAVLNFYINDCKDYTFLLNFLFAEINEVLNNLDEAKNRNTNTLFFNKAIILYHLQKPYASLNVLNDIIEKLEFLEEPLASKAGLFMLQLLIHTNQYKRAEIFANVLQKHLGFTSDFLSNECSLPAENCENIDSFQRIFKILYMILNIRKTRNVSIPNDGTTEFSFLAAYQYYLNREFQLAANELSKNFTSDKFTAPLHGEDENTYIANNMGIIHLNIRKFEIAANFFQHALHFDNAITSDIKEKSIFNIGASRKAEILYNLGIALLHSRRPKEAFECFLVPLKIYQNNPRLWLRVAEACIMLNEETNKSKEKNHIVSSVIGSGSHRKYVIKPNAKLKSPTDGQSFAIPYPNMEFASLCLRNAVSLVDSHNRKQNVHKSNDIQTKDVTSSDEMNYCNPSPPLKKDSLDRLTASIYAAYSFVSIHLGEYVVGLEYAKLLLQTSNISSANAMLGRLYCAEALIMLNRVNEAISYLDPQFVKSLNSDDFKVADWQINSVDAAQSIMHYNLVVALVLLGNFKQAYPILSTCTDPIVYNKYKMLKMYIDLVTGNVNSCKVMVRMDTPQLQ